MSQGPYEYAGLGEPDALEPVMDPDDEAERGYLPDSEDSGTPGNAPDRTGNAELNPYDTSWVPPDRKPHATDFGTTLAEQRQGETLDQRLAEEEPDTLAELDRDNGRLDAELTTEAAGEDSEVEEALREAGGDSEFPAPSFEQPEPRAGRLVAEDEGAHPDTEKDLVARDAGIAGAGASAEEAAVHIVDEP